MARRRDELSVWNSAYSRAVPIMPANMATQGRAVSIPEYMLLLRTLKSMSQPRPLTPTGSSARNTCASSRTAPAWLSK